MASWEEFLRNFMLEEEEEDEEFFCFLLPALMPYLDEEKIPEHTSSLTGAKKIEEILEGHQNWCKQEFRMEPEIFRAVANFFRTENLLHDTNHMKIEEHLGIFMFMLSHNASTDRLKKEFQHSSETIHRKIGDVFDIIPALIQKFIRLPNPSRTHMKIASDPRFMPFFQNCIGLIDGWRSISEKFAQMFPLAHFTKQQLQEKEKDLKGNWKAIRDALKESGVSWNESLSMLIAEPDKWEKWKKTKVAKFEKKPFPLFEECSLLYHGSVATGELNFTSTEHLQASAPIAPAAPAAPPAPTTLAAPAAPTATTAISDSTSMFTSFDGLPDDSSARNEAQSALANQESVQGARGGRKRKQSHIGSAVEDYVQFKKKQTSKTLEELSEKKKKDEQFSVDSCLDEVDKMDALTDEEKAYAMTIFKSEIDREVFMKMKNKNVRLIWLKQQIRAISRGMN